MAADNGGGLREEWILVRGGVNDGADTPVLLEHAAHSTKSFLLIRKIDKTDARNDGIKRSFRKVNILPVQNLRVDLRETGLPRDLLREFQNLGRNIGCQHTA